MTARCVCARSVTAEPSQRLSRTQSLAPAFALAVLVFLLPSPVPAEPPGGVKISGVAETTALAGHSPLTGWFSGLEQFANVRLTAPVGEAGTFNAAANLLASAGSERPLSTDGELERLYLSFRAERFDVDMGLMRIPFGYGLAFRPTDILNASNPLYPDARLSGVLGVIGSWYLGEETRLAAFYSDRAADDAYAADGAADPPAKIESRPLGGILCETHSPRYSAQTLLALRVPESGSRNPETRAGISLKVSSGVGLVVDSLLYHGGAGPLAVQGNRSWLKASVGADYTLLDGDLYVLAQYYFNGEDVRASGDRTLDYSQRHYLYASSLWKASPYTRFSASALVSLEDGSFVPILKAEHDVTRGVVLSAEGRAYLDATDFSSGSPGELGGERVGLDGVLTCKATVRF